MPFEGVLGHDGVRRLLGRALESDRVPPALLFSGPSGVGKKRLALAFFRALLCERPGERPCDDCGPCRRAAKGLHPDLTVVEASGAAIKVDQIRDVVAKIGGRPFEAKSRGVVIDDAHLMTEEGANALLKSLEEPPASSHVCLVTASPQALLPTIRSRCQEVRFGPLPPAVVEDQLARTLDRKEARLRAAVCGGSLGVALAFESEGYRALRSELLEVLGLAAGGGAFERLEAAEKLADIEDHALALTILRGLLRDVAVLRLGLSESVLNQDALSELEGLARTPLGAGAGRLADHVGEVRSALEGNANRLLSMDFLLEGLAAS
jgi:DNA polymerase-3 subunit delta'